jgi:hypothetical protein
VRVTVSNAALRSWENCLKLRITRNPGKARYLGRK